MLLIMEKVVQSTSKIYELMLSNHIRSTFIFTTAEIKRAHFWGIINLGQQKIPQVGAVAEGMTGQTRLES